MRITLGRLQFRIIEMLTAILCAALCISIFCSEGCGERKSKIASLEFSPENDRLAIVKYNWRKSRTFPSFDRDIKRTVSIVDFTNKASASVIESRYSSDVRGEYLRQELQCNHVVCFGPSHDTICLVTSYGDTYEFYDVPSQRSRKMGIRTIGKGALQLQAARDGNRIGIMTESAVFGWVVNEPSFLIDRVDGEFISSLIQGLAISGHGELVAVRGAGQIVIYDFQKRQIKKRLAIDDDITSFALSQDGRVLALQSPHMIKVAEVATSNVRTVYESASNMLDRHVEFLANENQVVISDDDRIKVLDTRTISVMHTLAAVSSVTAIAVSANSQLIAVGHSDGTIKIWNPEKDRIEWEGVAPGDSGLSWTCGMFLLSSVICIYLLRKKLQARACKFLRALKGSS